jgi:hypothetical protein
LEIYDAAGQRTAPLANGHFVASYHSVTWQAGNTASSIYYFKLITADVAKTRKGVLLK